MKLSKKQSPAVAAGAPTLKPVHPKRKELIVLAGLLIVIGLTAAYGSTKFYKNSGSNDDDTVILTEEQIQQSVDEFTSSQIEDSNIPEDVRSDIDKKIQNQDLDAARALIEAQLARTDLNDYAKEYLNANLYYICTETTDLTCLESTTSYAEENTEDENMNLWSYINTARAAKSSGDTEKAKFYYAKALKIVENLGGQDFVKTANERSEIPIDYQELVDGAQ